MGIGKPDLVIYLVWRDASSNSFRVSLGEMNGRWRKPPQPPQPLIDPTRSMYPTKGYHRFACSFRASGIQPDRQVFFVQRSALPIGATK